MENRYDALSVLKAVVVKLEKYIQEFNLAGNGSPSVVDSSERTQSKDDTCTMFMAATVNGTGVQSSGLCNNSEDFKTSEKLVVLELANERPVLHPSANERPVLHPSANERPVLHPSANERPVLHPSANERPVLHPSANERPVLHPSANESPLLQVSANERPLVQTSTNEKLEVKKSANESSVVQKSANERHLDPKLGNESRPLVPEAVNERGTRSVDICISPANKDLEATLADNHSDTGKTDVTLTVSQIRNGMKSAHQMSTSCTNDMNCKCRDSFVLRSSRETQTEIAVRSTGTETERINAVSVGTQCDLFLDGCDRESGAPGSQDSFHSVTSNFDPETSSTLIGNAEKEENERYQLRSRKKL